MINNVLDAAKIESGQVQLLLEDVAVEGVLGRCVSRCQGLLRDKAVSLELLVPPGAPPVRADFVQLQQVFTNRIANAIKFTETGRVEVRVRFDAGVPEGKLAVDVADTGIGIAKETLKLIWRPFQQADATVARHYGGTGLGPVDRLGDRGTCTAAASTSRPPSASARRSPSSSCPAGVRRRRSGRRWGWWEDSSPRGLAWS